MDVVIKRMCRVRVTWMRLINVCATGECGVRQASRAAVRATDRAGHVQRPSIQRLRIFVSKLMRLVLSLHLLTSFASFYSLYRRGICACVLVLIQEAQLSQRYRATLHITCWKCSYAAFTPDTCGPDTSCIHLYPRVERCFTA